MVGENGWLACVALHGHGQLALVGGHTAYVAGAFE